MNIQLLKGWFCLCHITIGAGDGVESYTFVQLRHTFALCIYGVALSTQLSALG